MLGLLVFLVCLYFAYPPHKYRNAVALPLPGNFGGFSLGMWIFYGKNNYGDVLPHEYGHSRQVMMLGGILYLFVVALPSVIRYWYREILYRKDRNEYNKLPPYDSIWFEHYATLWGEQAINDKYFYM